MEHIVDLENYVRSRQRKGKSAHDIVGDLMRAGYDSYAAQGLVMMYWETKEETASDKS